MGKLLPLSLCLALFASTGAHADETAEAKRLFGSATKHFDLAEYEAALNDFKEGYRHKDDPVFLYNIAQCYRLLKGHEEDAITFYKTYLRRVPQAPNRATVEHRIEELQAALAMQEKARTTPPMTTLKPGETPEEPRTEPTTAPAPQVVAVERAPAPPKPIYKKWWLWTAVGVVVVGVGVGLGVGLGAQPRNPTTTLTNIPVN